MTVFAMDRVCFSYPPSLGDPSFAIDDISFHLERGELLGILGPNGAGKSTLFRLALQTLRPSSGTITLGGRPLADLSPLEVARRLAWVPQEGDSVFSLTVEEMVRLGRFCHRGFWGRWRREDDRQVERALGESDLLALRSRTVAHLSGGQRRRVLLARALAQEPEILLLDEPTSHLDPAHQVGLISTVDRLRRERGLAVMVILHDVGLALSWCPSVLLLKDGRSQAQGPAEEVITPAHLQSVYGLEAVVHPPSSERAGSMRFQPNGSLEKICWSKKNKRTGS